MINDNKNIYSGNCLNNRGLCGGGVFDITKLILSILIVVLHADILPDVLHPILRLAVPLFFLMSSFFYHTKIKDLNTFSKRKNAMCHYVRRILYLYLFWTLILLPFIIITRWWDKDFFYIIKSFFVVGAFGASWFLIYSAYTVLILFLLSERFHFSNKLLLIISVVLYTLSLLSSNYAGIIGVDFVNNFNFNHFKFCLGFPTSFLWFVLGKIIAENQQISFLSRNKLFFLLAVMSLLYYMEYFLVRVTGISCSSDDCYICSIPLCTVLFILLLRVREMSFSKQKTFRKMSTMIFCVHYTIISCLNLLSERIFALDKNGVFVLTMMLCFIVSLMILLLDKTKAHNILRFAY